MAMPDTPQIQACEIGKPFYPRNEDFNSFVSEWCRAEGITSSGCIPILHDGKVIATLNLASHTWEEFPQATRLAVETIAAQIGGCLARVQAEELLREGESRYRLIAENASDVVWSARSNLPEDTGMLAHADPKTQVEALLRGWRFEYLSPSLEKVLGYSVAESMSDTPATRMDPAWHPAVAKILLDNLVERAPSQTFEFPMLAKDGSRRWCEVTVNILPTAPGEPLPLMGILRDITARHEAQEAVLQEQQLLRRLIDLQERERRYLSCEIHDGFTQQITGALFHLEAFNRLRETDGPLAERNLDQAIAMLRRSIDETRRLISSLRPPILDEMGILSAVEYLVCENRERTGIEIMFQHDLTAIRLAFPLENNVFRIVQEALTNACRHSGSEFIRVELKETGERLHVAVFDEGVGFDPAAVSEDGFGLRGIRERARLFGGNVEIRTAPGEGCLIRVDLPLVVAAGE